VRPSRARSTREEWLIKVAKRGHGKRVENPTEMLKKFIELEGSKWGIVNAYMKQTKGVSRRAKEAKTGQIRGAREA
jgi:hypothetical protein